MGQILDAYERYKRERDEIFHTVTMRIIEMLLFNGFVFYPDRNSFVKECTGCCFYLDSIEKYKSVLDFQLEYPYYSICGN